MSKCSFPGGRGEGQGRGPSHSSFRLWPRRGTQALEKAPFPAGASLPEVGCGLPAAVCLLTPFTHLWGCRGPNAITVRMPGLPKGRYYL